MLTAEAGAAVYASPLAGWESGLDGLVTSIRGGAAVVLRSKDPGHDPSGDLRPVLPVSGDPRPDQPRRRHRRPVLRRISFTRARDWIRNRFSDSGPFS